MKPDYVDLGLLTPVRNLVPELQIVITGAKFLTIFSFILNLIVDSTKSER